MSKNKYQSFKNALLMLDLLKRSEYQSSTTLGEALGVKSRTVQAYVEVMREHGWEVESVRARGYRLHPDESHTRLTREELFLFAILLAQGGSTLPTGDFVRLTDKLTRLISISSRKQVEKIQEKVASNSLPHRDIETLSAVGRCLADPHYQLVMDYRKSPESELERRNILPLSLRYSKDSFYVDSFDLDKNDSRSYRLDRFVKVQLLKQDKPIPRPCNGSIKFHKWDFGKGEAMEVKIKLTSRLAAWLRENPEHESQKITENQFATFRVKRLDMFVDWFMGLRGAQVVGPQELAASVRQRARTIADSLGTLEVDWD